MTTTLLTLCALSFALAGCPDESHAPLSPSGDAATSLPARDGEVPVQDSAAGDAGLNTKNADPIDGATPSVESDASVVSDAGVPDSAIATDASVPADYAPLESQALTKYKSCDAYEPSGDPAQYTVQDSYDACIARCVLSAPCDQIAMALCTDSENTLTHCVDRCDPDAVADGFRCPNGSAIPHAYLCDYESDCLGGEDEQGCGEFTCADGVVLENRIVRCDYFDDCADGSDEMGCAVQCN